MDISLCNQFLQDKTRNPKTNRKIKMNGPTYKKILKQCAKVVGVEKPKKGRKQKVPKKFIRKDIRKKIKQLPAPPKNYIERSEKQNDCNDWKKNPLKNPKTNRKIKHNGPTYKKFQKMCKGDKKVQESMKLIQTSVRKITSVYRNQSPDLIIKKGTKRVKDDKIRLQGGVRLTEMIMILYLLKKHKTSINMLLRQDFKKLFTKINTNKISVKDVASLDYLTMVDIDPYSNEPTNITFPYNDNGMDLYFWTLNNP